MSIHRSAASLRIRPPSTAMWSHALLALALLSTTTVGISQSAPADTPPGFAPAWAGVAATFHELADSRGVVGSGLALLHGDSVLAHEVQGFADLESERKVDADTIFHWASITKTLTALAILQLRDRGRLSLDDAVVDHLPELRAVHNPYGSMRDIEVRHLLSHTSGFRAPTWPWRSADWQPLEPTEWSQLVAMLPYTRIEFAPGTQYGYSNPGIIFLGRIIEQLSGDDYEVYIDKNVLMPLGMAHSYFDTTPYHLLGRRSNNYALASGRPVAGGLDFDTGITASNGGLNAPIPDMLRYARFLLGHADTDAARAVLARESLEEMWRPFVLANGAPSGTGLGWFLSSAGDARIVGHTGSQRSFRSFLYLQPESSLACIAAFNTQLGDEESSAFGVTRGRFFDEIVPLFVSRRDAREASVPNARQDR